ncbi:hypothetical protein [Neolewinella agarilytica]|uniref:Homeodomain-like domain-containing protein n=1 Tax=Neolewinella agarilytica TaxID=478744 RepID=A0A1H9PGE1_9BACT|nr:hypothetical protein [Neolewinella agarilytica]SER47281.1 hypothetical protein SAMN05444359_1512 [Neolewinella agarilytica]
MQIKTRSQIAVEYGVCRKTLRKWMADSGFEFPRHLTTSWQKLVYEQFDYPPGVEYESYQSVRLPRQYRDFFENNSSKAS